MNTGAPTVNRGEIVSMYAGLKAPNRACSPLLGEYPEAETCCVKDTKPEVCVWTYPCVRARINEFTIVCDCVSIYMCIPTSTRRFRSRRYCSTKHNRILNFILFSRELPTFQSNCSEEMTQILTPSLK